MESMVICIHTDIYHLQIEHAPPVTAVDVATVDVTAVL
jgi:hypothetical protein